MISPILLDIPEAFETERLLIRVPRPGDGPALNEAILETFEELRRWMPWARERPSVETSEENSRKAQAAFLKREDITLRFVHKQSGLFLGSSWLHPRDWAVPRFETGYWCRKRFQRQGYTTEAMIGILGFGFNVLKARRIEANCAAENKRSLGVATRVGMVREGEFRNHWVGMDGRLQTMVCFAMTEQDWQARQAADGLILRPCQPADEQAVISLWERCGLTRAWNDPHKDIERKLAVQANLFLVAVLDGRVVGSVMAGYEGHRGWINYLAVAPECRHTGLGRRLMHEAERRLLALGCPKINLQVRSCNETAIGFYLRIGYVQDDVLSLSKRIVSDEAENQ